MITRVLRITRTREDLMFKPEFLTRQFDLIPPEKQGLSIAIVGVGAIGSFTALSLAKMGYGNIRAYDFDVIDNENMNCQFYRHTDIGKKKTEALQELVEDFTGLKIRCFDEKIVDASGINCDVLIASVDSMEVRKMLASTASFKWFIDPRMSAEYASMDIVPADKIDKHIGSMYSDSDAVQERCTAKSTMYTVQLIAGQVIKAIKDISLEHNHIKTLDWNIAKNSIISWCDSGVRL